MPKLFASEIVIHDHDTGADDPRRRVKVNEPVFHRGVAIYQSSFDDGGSSVKLHALPMTGGGKAFDVEGTIGGSTELTSGRPATRLTLEFTGLRVINVENLGGAAAGSGTDVRKVDLAALARRSTSARAPRRTQASELRNVGPSVSYKLRDAAGQAREFNNYMLPVELRRPARVPARHAREPRPTAFRYLRIPADDNDSIDGWMRLRAALADPRCATQAARALRRARHADPTSRRWRQQLQSHRAARAGPVRRRRAGAARRQADRRPAGGLRLHRGQRARSRTRPRICEVLLRILNGSLFELLNLTREHAGAEAADAGRDDAGLHDPGGAVAVATASSTRRRWSSS